MKVSSTSMGKSLIHNDAVLGILDYRYVPYALGDTFTWLTNLNIIAHQEGLDWIDIVIATLPEQPSYQKLQPHITSYNYTSTVHGLMAAYWCSSKVRSVRLFEDECSFAKEVIRAIAERKRSWPAIADHFRKKLDFSTHKLINDFYNRNGWLPRLSAPVGYSDGLNLFRKAHLSEKMPCMVNIRQRALTDQPSAISRDSSSNVWLRFLQHAQKEWPNVCFVLVGNFNEWERIFARLDNVVISRAHGLGLGHELALLLDGCPFIGTSSGFSAAATFSDSPYLITNFEERAADYIGMPVGTARYPFAIGNQKLLWGAETTNLLIEEFGSFWGSIKHGASF